MVKVHARRLERMNLPSRVGAGLERILMGYFLFLTFLLIWVEFNTPNFNWDIDHELYFGQRLSFGELIWTTEYNDKLPLQQLLFLLPGYFGSVGIWRLQAVAVLVLLFWVLYFSLPKLLDGSFWTARDREKVAVYSIVLVGIMGSSFPEGISHTNLLASSSAMIAGIIGALAIRWRKDFPHLLTVTAAIAAVVSISVRPYLLLPIALIWIFYLAAELLRHRKTLSPTVVRFAALIGITGSLGLAGNFLPYVIAGRTDAFFDGLAMLAMRLNPNPAFSTFEAALTSPANQLVAAGLAVSTSILILVPFLRRLQTSLFLLVPMAGAILSLAIGISTRHWWDHYANLFVPYLAVLASLLLVVFLRKVLPQFENHFGLAGKLPKLGFIVGCVALGALVTQSFVERAQSSGELGRSAIEVSVLDDWLAEEFPSRPSFLFPESMKAHWILREGRHGFPHAANTGHIDLGWWEETDPDMAFKTFASTTQYCDALLGSDIEVILLHASSPLQDCFSVRAEPSRFTSQKLSDLGLDVVAWIRNENNLDTP